MLHLPTFMVPASPAQRVLCFALTLPWLWPTTWGPLTNAVPWMVSAACALVALACTPWLSRAQSVRALAWSLVTAAGLSALIALLQWFGQEGALRPLVAQASPGMAYGNLRQPNQLASLLAMGIWAALWLRRNRKQAASPMALALYVALISAALVASASRIGLVHIVVLWLVCIGWWWHVDRPANRTAAWTLPTLASGVLALYAMGVLVAPSIEGWLGSSQRDLVARLASGESTCGSRLILWNNVLHLISLKPWTGWGWGNLDWAHYTTLYQGPRFCHILDNAHNAPLQLAVELGLPAATLVCGLLLLSIWRAKPWAEADSARRLAWGILLVVGAHSMVEYPLWYGPFQFISICALLILLTSNAQSADQNWLNRGQTPQSPSAVPAMLAAALGGAALIYVAHDYWRVAQLFLASDQRASRYAEDTLNKVRDTRIFNSTVDFATVSITPVDVKNANQMLDLAERTLHYSPEPRVIEKLLESAQLLGNNALIQFHEARFQAAYPIDYKAWLSR